jgi:hypothetical protein
MRRLHLNQGRYHGEGLDVREYLAGFDQAARAHGWASEKFATIEGYELRAYRRSPENPTRIIYISTGIHGDEPAGPVALRRLIEENQWPDDTDFILCPCVNPTGLAAKTRENVQGIDLNRDYRNPQTPEVRAHVRWLESLPRFDLTLILHEDWEAEGYYVYDVNLGPGISPAIRIVEALRELCPIQPTGRIDDSWDCVDGIIQPNVNPLEREQWAEALYLIVNKSKLSLTLEAPSDFPLLFRAEAHVRAVRRALEATNSISRRGRREESAV